MYRQILLVRLKGQKRNVWIGNIAKVKEITEQVVKVTWKLQVTPFKKEMREKINRECIDGNGNKIEGKCLLHISDETEKYRA